LRRHEELAADVDGLGDLPRAKAYGDHRPQAQPVPRVTPTPRELALHLEDQFRVVEWPPVQHLQIVVATRAIGS
jgi:hypothetical protein